MLSKILLKPEKKLGCPSLVIFDSSLPPLRLKVYLITFPFLIRLSWPLSRVAFFASDLSNLGIRSADLGFMAGTMPRDVNKLKLDLES
jgi:hypothetical protein